MNAGSSVKQVKKIPGLYGLIVCGGKSIRMGRDKSMLQYHSKPQLYHLSDLLEPFCEKVLISCNVDQAKNIEPAYTTLADHPAFTETGPMASLLSAFTTYNDKDLLITGCDYPFLTGSDINSFLSLFNRPVQAAAFYNPALQLYEPLLAWYRRTCATEIFRMHANHEYSLQHFLKKNKALKFVPQNKQSIKSVNSPNEYLDAFEYLKDKR